MTQEVYASVKNLNAFYKDKRILSDINCSIPAKQVTALIGFSGSGKSTFLRCFNRMNDYVDGCIVTGSIILDGIEICGKNPGINSIALFAKVGMVFQKPNPFYKSIYENVAYGLKIHKMCRTKQERDYMVESALKRVGMFDEVKDRLKDSALMLSGGQQQRLCIARAIAVKPKMLLMDEPCSSLDPFATSKIEELIFELKQKFTILMVTHSLKQVKKVADEVIFFDKGKIVEQSGCVEFFDSPKTEMAKNYIIDH